jgi:Zn-dependent peptidase ImmA (M78 family)
MNKSEYDNCCDLINNVIIKKYNIFVADYEDYKNKKIDTFCKKLLINKKRCYNCGWSVKSNINEKSFIIIGFFKSYEKKIITFFHELGHILISEKMLKKLNNKFLIELECNNIAINEMKKYNIKFSNRNIKWLYENTIKSYSKYN